MSDCLNIIIFLLYNNMSGFNDDFRIFIYQDMLDGIQNSDDVIASTAYINMRKHITDSISTAVRNNGDNITFNIANSWFNTIINACDDNSEMAGGQTRRKKNKVLNKTRKK